MLTYYATDMIYYNRKEKEKKRWIPPIPQGSEKNVPIVMIGKVRKQLEMFVCVWMNPKSGSAVL